MKRYIVSGLLVLSSLGLSAQSMYDAYTFGATDYLGTARVVGLGGAVGAVGSDLGTIGVNPAGSAVASYSQFVVSPSLSMSRTQTSYALDPASNFGASNKTGRNKLKLPNIGLTTRFNSILSSDASVTFGFVMNTTYDYNYEHSGSGINGYSSKFAEMARAAQGIANDALKSNSFYDNSANSSLWDVAMGYNIGLINGYGADGNYVGCTEVLTSDGRRYVPGNLNQRSHQITSGVKNDIILNMAWNFSNKFYLGFNIGLPYLGYENVERYSEVAQVVEEFPIQFTYADGSVQNTYFDNATYQYNYTAAGSGMYGKIGAIYLPFAGLRLGFAYQTPTVMDITETWMHSGRVAYADGSAYSGSSREGSYNYTVLTPRHFDFALAYTFGRKGLISADVSIEDYSSVRFSDSYDDSAFNFVNAATSAFSGRAYNYRIGAEFNLTSNLAIRGGANILTSAEKYYMVGGEKFYYSDYNDDYYYGRKELPGNGSYVNDIRRSYSLGLGYNPAGSFFADFAVRWTTMPSTTYQPYYNYTDSGVEYYSPLYRVNKTLLNAVLTLGWRF